MITLTGDANTKVPVAAAFGVDNHTSLALGYKIKQGGDVSSAAYEYHPSLYTHVTSPGGALGG